MANEGVLGKVRTEANMLRWMSVCVCLSVSVLTAIFLWTWVSRYQNVSILDYIGAKDDCGRVDNWSYKACKAPVKMSPPTN